MYVTIRNATRKLEFDPDPYMEALGKYGLPWKVEENPVLVE